MATAQPLLDSAPWRRRRRPGPARARFAAILAGAQRLLHRSLGAVLLLLSAGLAAALFSYQPADPSLNHATAAAARNLAGSPGAFVADLLLQGFGLAGALPVLPLLLMGARILAGGEARAVRLAVATLVALPLAAAALGLGLAGASGPAGAGAGGVVGLAAVPLAESIAEVMALDPGLVVSLGSALAALLALALLLFACSPTRAERNAVAALFRRGSDDDRPDAAAAAPSPRGSMTPPAPQSRPTPQPEGQLRPIRGPAPQPPPARAADRQPGLALGDRADLPPIALLKPAPRGGPAPVDNAALEQNARLLESVLDEYGVKGRIVGLAQGPVVTLYELEPAPGIKASRVIGLADDIARSMCAVSARVAVVPGRNIIGIELPNVRRDMVSLSELIASDSFQRSGGTLPLVLGKDIAGAPVIVDLAPMPHLLIAGTTGSGKSVGLNAMILSLLYRLRPDQCRMIMIDPKMLELSVYGDIPHLLTPVVIDPPKAVRALRWAVEQMEERYRNMAHLNVRSLSAFNDRVREALRSGSSFTKQVQTGWDDEGRPLFEEMTLPLEPLPMIVVVVDEFADLMLTAGKEVEVLIQRLTQKARAAGIHVIMATQRPSVDIITGVIKANLPTRISFQVPSKIDSRTILGEQGAEQLLGKGDMLYMAGGKQVMRVHGPFVSDEEVLAVATHWKAQGSPDYLSDVTEDPDGDGPLPSPAGGAPGGRGSGGAAATPDNNLQQAIQIVASSRKATISYLQRQLRIGYNSAARLIEEMQEMGLISAPDHVGRREVLMDEAGNRLP